MKIIKVFMFLDLHTLQTTLSRVLELNDYEFRLQPLFVIQVWGLKKILRSWKSESLSSIKVTRSENHVDRA